MTSHSNKFFIRLSQIKKPNSPRVVLNAVSDPGGDDLPANRPGRDSWGTGSDGLSGSVSLPVSDWRTWQQENNGSANLVVDERHFSKHKEEGKSFNCVAKVATDFPMKKFIKVLGWIMCWLGENLPYCICSTGVFGNGPDWKVHLVFMTLRLWSV